MAGHLPHQIELVGQGYVDFVQKHGDVGRAGSSVESTLSGLHLLEKCGGPGGAQVTENEGARAVATRGGLHVAAAHMWMCEQGGENVHIVRRDLMRSQSVAALPIEMYPSRDK